MRKRTDAEKAVIKEAFEEGSIGISRVGRTCGAEETVKRSKDLICEDIDGDFKTYDSVLKNLSFWGAQDEERPAEPSDQIIVDHYLERFEREVYPAAEKAWIKGVNRADALLILNGFAALGRQRCWSTPGIPLPTGAALEPRSFQRLWNELHPDDLPISFGFGGDEIDKSMKARRMAAGYTQAELASLLGVASTQVARWESGQVTPYPATRAKIAAVLGCTVEDLGFPEREER